LYFISAPEFIPTFDALSGVFETVLTGAGAKKSA
jgi:hypothetical protein